jgi:hypothetical protein
MIVVSDASQKRFFAERFCEASLTTMQSSKAF